MLLDIYYNYFPPTGGGNLGGCLQRGTFPKNTIILRLYKTVNSTIISMFLRILQTPHTYFCACRKYNAVLKMTNSASFILYSVV